MLQQYSNLSRKERKKERKENISQRAKRTNHKTKEGGLCTKLLTGERMLRQINKKQRNAISVIQ